MAVYNPYYDIQNVVNAKAAWGKATTDEERTRQNEIANTARKNLEIQGYGDIAKQISADGANEEMARNIMKQYAPVTKVSAEEMANYNPYYDLKTVVDAKVAWNNATTDEERTKQNGIATEARKVLEAYGYGDLAESVSAYGADATAARAVLDKYAPVAPTSQNDTDSELMTKHNNEIRNKTNTLWGTQTSDRATMTDKYGRLEETAYSNPFTTAEAKAILGKYDLAGLQGRDNAVASGGASNGGNIDSYAASNALRQQASLTNLGQLAVLEAHNNKINNVKGILSDMGVYLQNQDAGMQNTIMLQQTESQRLFENDETSKQKEFERTETAKNNETARLKEQASVTGYTPNEWVIQNDAVYNEFLNPDGTFKKEKEGIDIQALINQANASGDTETAQKLAVVRAKKILGNYGAFGQYSNVGDISFMKPQQTEDGRQFDKSDATTRESFETDKYIADSTNKANVAIAESTNKANVDIANSTNNANIAIAKGNNATDITVAGIKATTSGSGSLTGSQATSALKNGELNQTILDAYNAQNGTSYTMDNPPPVYKKSAPMTDSQVKAVFDGLNADISGQYGSEYTAVNKSGSSYSVGSAGSEYIVYNVLKNSSLTDAQKEYLLCDLLGISEDVISTVKNDKHFK